MSPPATRYAIALDVGGTKLAGALVNLATGTRHAWQERPTRPERGGRPVLADAVALANELSAAAQSQARPVAGVGVAVCELVDLAGRVTSSHAVAWAGLPVADAFSHLGPVVIEADVRAHAWAEAAWGAGRDLRQFVFVTVGTGISSCLVLDGRPYPGARGNALVLASSPTTTLCPVCGNEHWPPLEDYAGGPALVSRYNALAKAYTQRAEDVLAAAHEGDPRAHAVVITAARALGASLAWLVNVLDPNAVIVGGGLGTAGGLYWDTLVAGAREHIWAPATRQLPIVQARLGPEAALAGAAQALATTLGSAERFGEAAGA